jgi:DNA-directed RNA polymerase specialized sigma24 family protein
MLPVSELVRTARTEREVRTLAGLEQASVCEQACLRRLAKGEDSWVEFWELFGAVILHTAAPFMDVYSSAADELVSDLACRLLAHDGRVLRRYLATPSNVSFIPLLRTITRNLAIDSYRRLHRHSTISLDDSDSIVQLVQADAGSRTDQQVLWQLVAQVCGGRETPSFCALYLRYSQGWSVNAIAEQLHLQPNAVSQRIRYYLRRLNQECGTQLLELMDA